MRRPPSSPLGRPFAYGSVPFSSVALGRGAGTSLIHSVHTGSEFVLVLRLESVNAASTIKLTTENLVGLTESVKLGRQVGILTLEASCMFFECFFLSCQVSTVVPVCLGLDTKAVDVSSAGKELVFFLLKSHFCVTNLNCHIGVTAFLEVYFFSKIVIFSADSLVISSETSVSLREICVRITDSCQLSLGILKSQLLCSQILAASIN